MEIKIPGPTQSVSWDGMNIAEPKLKTRKPSNIQHPGPPQSSLDHLISLFHNGQHQLVRQQSGELIRQFPLDHVLHNLHGAASAALGDMQSAMTSYTKALEAKPDYAEAFNNLGTALQEQGRTNEAINSFKEAVRLKPGSVDAHFNMAVAWSDSGQHEQSVKCYKRALKIHPHHEEALNNLGNSLREIGRPDDAIACYRQALRVKPDYNEAHVNYACTLVELDQLDEAIARFRQVLRLNPAHFEALAGLGSALKKKAQLAEASRCFSQALAVQPQSPDVLSKLGTAQLQLGHTHSAISSFEQAISAAPDMAEAHLGLGIALRESGRLGQAIKCYRKTIELDPGNATAHRNLSTLKTYQACDSQLPAMQQLLKNEPVSREEQMQLAFALGKAHDDLGEYDEAFSHFTRANQLRYNSLVSAPAPELHWARESKKTYSSDLPALATPAANTPVPRRPIFIIGMLRSGTSLVEQIISSHPDVHGGGELDLFDRAVAAANWPNPENPRPDLEKMRQTYLQGISRLGTSKFVVTDKMPGNFLHLGHILSAIPEARVIHTIRDARATCWSIYRHYFGGQNYRYAYNLEALHGFYTMYRDLMSFWHRQFPGRIHDLGYEQLTENQAEETRKLLENSGLDWNKNCLDFQNNTRAVRTASASQVRQEMYQGSSEQWRHYQSHLEPWFKQFSKG